MEAARSLVFIGAVLLGVPGVWGGEGGCLSFIFFGRLSRFGLLFELCSCSPGDVYGRVDAGSCIPRT